MLLLTVTGSALVCAASQQFGSLEDAWAIWRNLLGFLGLVPARFLSAATPATPLTAIVFAGMMLSRTPDGTLFSRVRPIPEAGNGPSLLIALVPAAAGVCSTRAAPMPKP